MTCDWFSPGWKEENWFRSYPTPLIGSLTGDQHQNCRQTSRVKRVFCHWLDQQRLPRDFQNRQLAAARPTHWKIEATLLLLRRKACMVWDGNPVCLFNAHGLGGPSYGCVLSVSALPCERLRPNESRLFCHSFHAVTRQLCMNASHLTKQLMMVFTLSQWAEPGASFLLRRPPSADDQ